MENRMRLYEKKPAKQYLEGFPIGNGRLGAMLTGQIESEEIVLNEDSVWSGGFRNRVNPDAREAIPKLRKLIFDGKVWEAEKNAFYSITGTPEGERAYQPLASLILQYYYPREEKDEEPFTSDSYVQKPGSIIAKDYERKLLLEEAVYSCSFSVNGILYHREAIASYPDQVIAIHLTSSRKKAISFAARLNRAKHNDFCKHKGKDTLLIGTQTEGNGVFLETGIKVVPTGGDMEVIGQHLLVTNADEAVIYISGTTTYYEAEVEKRVLSNLDGAAKTGYKSIRASHVRDFSDIYNRVSFRLMSETDEEDKPTSERLEALKNGKSDLKMDTLFYQYGRYLMISGSRPGSLPMNLRGIWNHEMTPPWDSKFTININQEMLYWPVDMCNMSECGIPEYDLISRMYPRGKKVAKEMYGLDGFVAHHNTDLYGDCAPQDIHRAAFWALGGAWMVLSFWDYYDYNQDLDFLRKYYPIMEDAAKFILGYLTEDREGYLVTCPSHSPENGYYYNDRRDIKPSITYAPTIDNMLIRYLFRRVKEAAELLSIEDEVTQAVTEAARRLHPVRTGKYGQIMEWVKDYEEPEPGHRHMAHMFALHPADDISLYKTPKLADAARISIDRRLAHQKPEDGKNGWTLSWMMLFEARLGESKKAYEYVKNMFRHAVAPNLFGLCVTDQIYVLDGNLGMTTAMTELVIQSQGGEINFLPALPKEWKEGSLGGIKARGGILCEVEWKEHKLYRAAVTAKKDRIIRLRCRNIISISEEKNQKEITFVKEDRINGTYCISFHAEGGKKYEIKLIK